MKRTRFALLILVFALWPVCANADIVYQDSIDNSPSALVNFASAVAFSGAFGTGGAKAASTLIVDNTDTSIDGNVGVGMTLVNQINSSDVSSSDGVPATTPEPSTFISFSLGLGLVLLALVLRRQENRMN